MQKKVKSFRVSTRHSGSRRFVRVSVYSDAESMRKAALRYHQQVGFDQVPQDEYDEAYGVTHIVDVTRIHADGSETRNPTAAHIRLYDGALGTSVIAHEATHAAMSIYEQDCLSRGSVHDGMEFEEILAYLVGDLASRIVGKIYEFGYYEKV